MLDSMTDFGIVLVIDVHSECWLTLTHVVNLSWPCWTAVNFPCYYKGTTYSQGMANSSKWFKFQLKLSTCKLTTKCTLPVTNNLCAHCTEAQFYHLVSFPLHSILYLHCAFLRHCRRHFHWVILAGKCRRCSLTSVWLWRGCCLRTHSVVGVHNLINVINCDD